MISKIFFSCKATQNQGTCAVNHYTVQSYSPMCKVGTQFPFYIVLDAGAAIISVSFFSFELNQVLQKILLTKYI